MDDSCATAAHLQLSNHIRGSIIPGKRSARSSWRRAPVAERLQPPALRPDACLWRPSRGRCRQGTSAASPEPFLRRVTWSLQTNHVACGQETDVSAPVLLPCVGSGIRPFCPDSSSRASSPVSKPTPKVIPRSFCSPADRNRFLSSAELDYSLLFSHVRPVCFHRFHFS